MKTERKILMKETEILILLKDLHKRTKEGAKSPWNWWIYYDNDDNTLDIGHDSYLRGNIERMVSGDVFNYYEDENGNEIPYENWKYCDYRDILHSLVGRHTFDGILNNEC